MLSSVCLARSSCLFLAFRGKGQADLKQVAFRIYPNVGFFPVPRFQPLLDIFQSQAARAARRRIGIPGILHDNRQQSILPLRTEAHVAAFGKTGDAVFHGILDEGLQQQRWQQAGFGFFLDVFVHLQTVTEANFFNRQVFLQ